MPRKERLPDNVTSYVDRHGRRRYRFRRTGLPSRHFKAHPNTPEGRAELAAFKAGKIEKSERYPPGTVGWIAARYFASPAFTGRKNAATAHNARRILDEFVRDYARDTLANFRFDHIETILARAAKVRTVAGRKRGGPSAASNLRGELAPLFDYGFKLLGVTKPNPVDQAAKIAVPKGGYHSWSEDEIARFRAHWPLGTKPRLALEIMLWTWQRRGDAASFGRRHIRDGRIEFIASKNDKPIWLTIAPQLQAAIDAMPVVGVETFLVTEYGRPFTTAGFGNWFGDRCREAGVPGRAHGLRKAGATRAANLGASNQMLKAVGGWSGDQEVSIYTAAADQARLAADTLAAVVAFDAGLANRGETK